MIVKNKDFTGKFYHTEPYGFIYPDKVEFKKNAQNRMNHLKFGTVSKFAVIRNRSEHETDAEVPTWKILHLGDEVGLDGTYPELTEQNELGTLSQTYMELVQTSDLSNSPFEEYPNNSSNLLYIPPARTIDIMRLNESVESLPAFIDCGISDLLSFMDLNDPVDSYTMYIISCFVFTDNELRIIEFQELIDDVKLIETLSARFIYEYTSAKTTEGRITKLADQLNVPPRRTKVYGLNRICLDILKDTELNPVIQQMDISSFDTYKEIVDICMDNSKELKTLADKYYVKDTLLGVDWKVEYIEKCVTQNIDALHLIADNIYQKILKFFKDVVRARGLEEGLIELEYAGELEELNLGNWSAQDFCEDDSDDDGNDADYDDGLETPPSPPPLGKYKFKSF